MPDLLPSSGVRPLSSVLRPPSSVPCPPSPVLRPHVSVILPIRNEAPFIEEALRAVLNQDYPSELIEVVVADGMSEDGTREIVRELAGQDPRLRVVDNPKQITPAGLNLAIRASRGAVIMRVDGHGVLPPNYVRECVAFLEGGKQKAESRKQKSEDGEGGTSNIQHPTSNIEQGGHGVLPPDYVRECVAYLKAEDGRQKTEDGRQKTEDGSQSSVLRLPSSALCPLSSVLRPPSSALLAVGGAWDCVGRGVMGEAIALATSSRFGVGGSRYRTCSPVNQPVLTDSVPFWAMRRQVFERIGLFREEMLCHEDYEFNYRLRSAGGTILLLPWLRTKYCVRSTLGGLARQYWRYGIWKGRFLCSQPESLQARHLIPPLFVTALAAGALALFLGAAGRFGLGALVALYVCFLLAATASLACSRGRRRETAYDRKSEVRSPKSEVGHWRCALLLPIILVTLHLCWGTGVWIGLLRGKVSGEPPRLSPVRSAS
jgi:glycosyltransferase involved in cell wall biosynthesis